MTDPTHVVVRAFGSGRCHVAHVTPDQFYGVQIFGRDATVVAADVVETMCGARLRASRGTVVVMHDTAVDCRPCRRITGVSAVRQGCKVEGPR